MKAASNPKPKTVKTVQSQLMKKLKMKKKALINETKQVEKVMMLVEQNKKFKMLKKPAKMRKK